jgi:hypothetical protein
MDEVRRSRLIKGAIAIFVGLPGTVTLFPLAAMMSLAAITGFASEIIEGRLQDVGGGLLLFAWSTAGVVGVLGFWAWIFAARRLSQRGRRIAAACVLAGIAAVSPLAFDGGWISMLAILGLIFGLLICRWLLRPGTLADPDGPTPRASG